MTMRARNNAAGPGGWLTSLSVPLVSALALLMCAMSNQALAQHPGGAQQHSAPPPHAAPAPQVHSAPPPQNRPAPAYQSSHPAQPYPELRAPSNPGANGSHFVESGPKTSYANIRPGAQHLPEWLNNHQNQTPKQQEDALRREPGFRDLPADQQQRLVNRLHSLDEKTPEQRQRILDRNEAFEHLSPQRQQEVRGASQALSQMSPDRQQALRHAFHDLRQMPPQQRQQMLNSGSYASQFTPQERTVLGNLLSIEPSQRPGAIAQPYFGR